LAAASTHLSEDHGRDLLGRESLPLTKVLNLDHRGAALLNDLEWPRLDILLDGLVTEIPTDKTLDIEDCVSGVHGGLVLSGLTDQTLLSGERDERRGSERSLLVGNYDVLILFF